MSVLRPYQVGLLQSLQQQSRDVVVIAPVGAGVRAVLIEYLGQASTAAPSLIVTDRASLADQWIQRLSKAGLPTRLLSSRADALEWATEDFSPPHALREVAVTTRQCLSHSFTEAGKARHIHTLVIDGFAMAAESVSRRLVENLRWLTERTIFLGTHTAAFAWATAAMRTEISLADAIENRELALNLTMVTYDQSDRQIDLLVRANELLQGSDLSTAASTLQAAHESLIDAVGRLNDRQDDEKEAEGELGQAMWALIDELESTTDDPRLEALLGILRDPKRTHGATLILTHRLAEMEYLLTALTQSGVSAVTLRQSSDAIGPATVRPRVLITSPSILTRLSGIPAQHLIIWSAPADADQLTGLLSWAVMRQAAVILLTAETSSIGDSRLLEALERIRVSMGV